jgi:hypothetical protein
MSKSLYQIAMAGSVIIYMITHIPSLGGHADNGFEFTVARQSDAAQQAQWLVKMSAGTFTMNFSWNP